MSVTKSTTKPVNLSQLSAELSGAGLTMVERGGNREITAHDATTQSALDAAISAHTPVDEDGNRRTMEAQVTQALAANRDYLALSAPTVAQNTAQIKLLTREMTALIRLLLGKLDAAD